MVSETQLGDPLVDALERMAQRLDVRDVDWVVQAIRIQQTVGGKLADLLHTLADFIRAREEIRREIDVLTAEGRISAYVLGALPLFLGVFIQVTNPGYLDPMFQGWGWVWLGGAVASVASAWSSSSAWSRWTSDGHRARACCSCVAGAAIALVGLAQRETRAGESDDAEEYLRSLDRDDDEADEFEPHPRRSRSSSRVVRPLGRQRPRPARRRCCPGNYRERIHTAARPRRAGRPVPGRGDHHPPGARRHRRLPPRRPGSSPPGRVGGGIGHRSSSCCSPVVGVQLPKSWLDRKVEERKDAIRRDLPDTLDLLAISVEAGVGFEGALGVVCDNFDSPLADEFARTLREMELGLPRREALQNLKKRTEVPELSNFVLTLTQADALGMPVGRVLKTSADGDAHEAPAVGAGEGGEAAGEDPVPAGPVHLPGDLRGAAGPGRLRHRQRVRLSRGDGASASLPDSLRTFAQAILVIRWGTTAVSIASASPGAAPRRRHASS